MGNQASHDGILYIPQRDQAFLSGDQASRDGILYIPQGDQAFPSGNEASHDRQEAFLLGK